ncbi:efflux RND transporter periplasmic adaptor subunit [Marinobacter sp. 2_MG-2023]|uniref:efflux RND transporter periplasmic adaptor subunit n=1 Tax=Marinobacter sp. 2_MG-2023 TaxID=3062679 RepID=UPI0026E42D19|nr:efflux RND transporter periplasmic adaptor subunit [Marinobacter sp. 2_MG-2023]MDO6440947.1 efflux RND transporter periplasmic adaptor subunit [Marinobacter sp. 2_MG-2023]
MASSLKPHSWNTNSALFAIICLLQPSAVYADNAVHSPVPAVDCVINPSQVADVSSPVSGVVEQVLVQRSEQVRKGQAVAQMNADVERANFELAQYRADILSEIELSKINLAFDTSRIKRSRSLSQKQVIAVEDVDEVEREFSLSQQRLVQARELARVRELELQRAREQLGQKTIRAPFDGFVIDTLKQSGEHVEEDAILRMAQLNPLVVEAIVPMEYFRDIELNMLAKVVPETLVNEQLHAMVSIIDRIGDTASNTFGVRLELQNPHYRIPAGLKCTVKFLQNMASDTEPGQESEQRQGVEQGDPQTVYYLLTTKQADSHQKTSELTSRLRAAGVTDPLTMDQGPHSGMILLGLFNSLEDAEVRRKTLEDQGFKVSITKGV